ncbi:MAG: surface glycan-binding family protein, partial [Candidatus Cryptobacteroides sp.]
KVSITYKYAGQDLSSNDALIVKCLPGVPEGLLVNPSAASVEDKDIAAGSSAELPVFTLATNGESAAVTGYEVKAVRKDGVDFAFTGLVTVENNTVRIQHGNWPLGDYTFDIKVNTESFGSASDKGVFTDVFSLTVFEKLALTYDSATKKEHTLWSISPLTPMPAGYTYSFTDPAASYTAFISLDPSTGVLSALKGNNLPKGSHLVSVTASAAEQESSTASFALEVVENPYYFTYFSYGNNLGLTEEQTDGVSQYRVKAESELTSLTFPVKYTDLAAESGVVFKIKTQTQTKATISKTDGTLSFEVAAAPAQQMGVVLVTATTTDPEDAGNTWTLTVPFCVDYSADAAINVRYSPFVFRVNPQTGGRSAVPQITGATAGKFLMDYRRTFNYYNINGADADGVAFVNGTPGAGKFLGFIWDDFSAATNLNLSSGAANYGGKVPVSYYNGTALKTEEQYALTPAYVDGSEGTAQFSVVVNPGLWQHNGGWADGVFTGQMTYVNTGNVSGVNNGTQIFPLAIWLDPTFEK